MIAYLLVVLASLAGIAGTIFFMRKNFLSIKEKNKEEPRAYKRGLNYALSGLWYGYLLVFFVGLSVNNFFF